MFYDGSLQEGIATAVQRNKTVVCFVTDDQEESKQWEDDFLVDNEISGIIRDEAVALRLIAGSEEAGYLAAIFPLPKSPTLVILKNGELKEYISSGASKETFLQRTLNSFGRKRKPTPEPAPSSSPTSEQTAAGIIAAALSAASSPVIRASNSRGPSPPPYSATAPAPTSTPPLAENSTSVPQADNSTPQITTLPPASSTNSTTINSDAPVASISASTQEILAERAARLSAQRAEDDRIAREAASERFANPVNPKQSAHAVAIKKQRAAELAEKKRILQRIEDAKATRHQQVMNRSASKQTIGSVASALTNSPSSSIHRSAMAPMAALQVRLEDGSSIRSRFPRDNSLGVEVRQWVVAERKARELGDTAFSFKVIQTPLPNRIIDLGSENSTLAEVGLLPSATLVLVPIEGAVSAYSSGFRPFGFIVTIFTWFMGMIYAFLGIVTGAPNRPVEDQHHESLASDVQAEDNRRVDADELRRRRQQSGSTRIRGFENADKIPRGEHQFYNGNSTNFEPRPDDE